MDIDALGLRSSFREWLLTADELLVLLDCLMDAECRPDQWLDYSIESKSRSCFCYVSPSESENRLRAALFGLSTKGFIGLVESQNEVKVNATV